MGERIRVVGSNGDAFKVWEIIPRYELSEEEIGPYLYSGLKKLINRAYDGDNSLFERLRNIHKLIYAEQYELSASVARGMAIRGLMSELSTVVEPSLCKCSSDPHEESIFQGKIKLTDNKDLQSLKVYKTAKAYWRKGSTLQSLATRIYLKEINPDLDIDESTIRRDMRNLQEWDESEGGMPPSDFDMIFSTGESKPFRYCAEDSRKPGSGSKRQQKR